MLDVHRHCPKHMLHINLLYLIMRITTLWSKYCYYPHFTDETQLNIFFSLKVWPLNLLIVSFCHQVPMQNERYNMLTMMTHPWNNLLVLHIFQDLILYFSDELNDDLVVFLYPIYCLFFSVPSMQTFNFNHSSLPKLMKGDEGVKILK